MSKLFSEVNPELEAYREKIVAINAEASARFQDPQWRTERSQEMAAAIYMGFDSENLVDLFTEVERLPLDGRSFITEVRGMKAFHMAAGGHIEESNVHAERMEIPHDQIGFAVSEYADKLEVNFAETADTLVQLGVRRLDAAINQRVFNTFQAAITSGSPYYISASGLSLAALNTAIAEVEDETLTGELTIVGRATMTRKIIDAITDTNAYGAFLPETNEALLQRGVLGVYRGVRIVTLKNYLDGDGNSFFPANELWVIGRDAGKTAFYGGTKVMQEIDTEWNWHYRQRMSYGVAVARPSHARRIVDTSQSA
jgi:hypothetical protein